MYWQSNLNSSDRQYLLDMGEIEYFDIEINFEHYNIGDYDIPAWSLAALLDVLNKSAYSINEDGIAEISSFRSIKWSVSLLNCGKIEPCYADNPIDACVEMIIKISKLKML